MVEKNNRKTFRVECKNPICAQISIVEVNNKIVKSRKGNICVENISLGGLQFLSAFNMPVNNTMILQFRLAIGESLIELYGYLVRKEKVNSGILRYGVQFSEEFIENEQALNEIDKINKDLLENNAYFCNRNVAECIKKNNYRKNKRTYKRYKFNGTFSAQISIVKVNDKKLTPQWEKILVNDISKGGMQILTSIKLPMIKKLMLNFKIIVRDNEIPLKGIVVRREETNNNMYIYGISFEISEAERELLEKCLMNEADFSDNMGIHKRKCLEVKFYKQRYVRDESNEWWV